MTNKNYNSGRGLEYRMKVKLEAEGYFVVRAAGSHGVADLVAIKHSLSDYPLKTQLFHKYEILFVSCKTPQYAPPSERKALIEAAQRCGAVPMLTKKVDGEWTLQRLEPQSIEDK